MVFYCWLGLHIRKQGLGYTCLTSSRADAPYENKDLDGYTCLTSSRAGALQLEESTDAHCWIEAVLLHDFVLVHFNLLCFYWCMVHGASLRPFHRFLVCLYSLVHGVGLWKVEILYWIDLIQVTASLSTHPIRLYIDIRVVTHIQLSFTLIWTIAGLETNYSQSKQTSSPCLDDLEEYLKSRKSQHCHSTELTVHPWSWLYCVFISANCC